MIDLYYYPTPNTWKVSIMLEECGLPYRLVFTDITAGAQDKPAFRAIGPNGKIPVIVDNDALEGPLSIFESGAILQYLAEKTGKFLPSSGSGRAAVLEWLFWQMAGLGPTLGQAGHFIRYAPPGNEYATKRYSDEAARNYRVLDDRLAGRDWIAGEYSIADMACWGWVWLHPIHRLSLDDYPNIKRWYLAMGARPAVRRAKSVGMEFLPDVVKELYAGEHYTKDEKFGADTTLVRSAKAQAIRDGAAPKDTTSGD